MRDENIQRDSLNTPLNKNDHHWGIILAGGEGSRLRNLSEKLYGYHRPKQFCTLIGSRSLYNHTVGRVGTIIPPIQILTVVSKHHADYFIDEIDSLPAETVVVQPCARETSAGILYPLLKIHERDPNSVVSIFPSDHFIEEESRFMNYVNSAKQFVEQNPEIIIMLGVKPERVGSGYGWIRRGDLLQSNDSGKIYQVQKFYEKPEPELTGLLMRAGCLLNTFVLIGKSATFLDHIKNYIPHVYNAFELIRFGINTALEKSIVETNFKHIPEENFSTSVLQKISKHLAVMEVTDIHWSDWGEEQRIFMDVNRLNAQSISIKAALEQLLEIAQPA